MKIHKFKDTRESYIIVSVLGLTIGIITELVNLLPNDGLWGLSSIAGSYGFWIFTTTFVIYFSCSNKNAMFNTFLYLANMCIGFYALQAIVVLLTPDTTLTGFLEWEHLTYWTVVAALCSLVAFVLYFWNSDRWYSNILCALPLAGMVVDTIGCVLKVYYSHTQLLQCILNVIFSAIMLVVFFRKSKKKPIFLIALVIVVTIGHFMGVSQASYNLTNQATIICELDGQEETFHVEIRDDGKIVAKSGSEEVYEAIDIDSLKNVYEIIHALQEFYESRGGSWRMGE